MNKQTFIGILLVINFLSKYTEAQINNDLLKQDIVIKDSLEDHVLFSVANQNFLKNNEYYHDITTGYTLFGSMLSTQVAYLPSPNLRLQAGVFFRKDFGNASLYSVEPLLTLKYQKNGYAVLIGNLEGNVSHRLIEPVFNYERFITNYNENGIQVKINKKKIWSDTWINWEVMEYNKSNYQEEFAAGNSTLLHLVDDGKNRFTIPLQGIITHIGGQVDIDTNAVRSKANLAIGFEYSRKLNGFWKEISTKNYYTIYKELAPSKLVAISEGRGLYLNTEIKTKYNLNASVSYWNGLNFLAPRGGDLFQSISSYYSQVNVLERNRKLLFVRLLYQKTVFENFIVDVRFEPYIDLINKFFEHSYSIYLTYKKDFGLVKLKHK